VEDLTPEVRRAGERLRACTTPARKGVEMWWWFGIGGVVLYLILLFTIGLITLRKGHGWMFFFGIFFPLFWLIGAFMQPVRSEYA
jgi:hypothetical protein